MDSDSVLLRPVNEDDLPVLDRFLMDQEASGPFEWSGWWDPGRFRRGWDENGLLGSDAGYLMVVRGADRLGFVGWRKVVTSQNCFCWNVGIRLLPEARGRGCGTEAQRQLVHYLFAHTQVARIEADTEVGNIAEQRALEKAGFTREGVLRSYGYRDGQWRDGVIYSILRNEVTPGPPSHGHAPLAHSSEQPADRQ